MRKHNKGSLLTDTGEILVSNIELPELINNPKLTRRFFDEYVNDFYGS
jgi:hypothetical protein